jgi:hypothetical protein
MNANVLINSLNTGEVSGLVSDRSDLSKYGSACKKLENFVPLVEGGAKKMPGTYFAGTTENGGAMFTASIAGTTMTVTAVNYGVIQIGQELYDSQGSLTALVIAYGTGTGGVGNYTISASLTVVSTTMQTASNGMSRLVPFQFSTDQGAILELSAGMVRIWEGATEGSWSLGLALQVPFSGSGSGVGGGSWSIPGTSASTSITGGNSTNSATTSGFSSVPVTGSIQVSVSVNANGSVSGGSNGGGGGSVTYLYSIDSGATWISFGGWGFSETDSYSRTYNFGLSGLSNLNTLQFKVTVSAGSGGVTPPTELTISRVEL